MDGFRGIPGVPEGWELVRIGTAYRDEYVVTANGVAPFIGNESKNIYPIVRKIEKPKRHRPFANGDEFKPHREKWWKWKVEGRLIPPAWYDDESHNSISWRQSFDEKVFDDGSPFGVEVTDDQD